MERRTLSEAPWRRFKSPFRAVQVGSALRLTTMAASPGACHSCCVSAVKQPFQTRPGEGQPAVPMATWQNLACAGALSNPPVVPSHASKVASPAHLTLAD